VGSSPIIRSRKTPLDGVFCCLGLKRLISSGAFSSQKGEVFGLTDSAGAGERALVHAVLAIGGHAEQLELLPSAQNVGGSETATDRGGV
jgi:hypothetical protein